MIRYLAILLVLPFLTACTPTNLANPTNTADQKQCCSGGNCQDVADDIVECDIDEIAQTCDDNGENCTSHGGSSFPD